VLFIYRTSYDNIGDFDMKQLIVRLTGQEKNGVKDSFIDKINDKEFWKGKMGASQLNEILLAKAYDTVTEDFFNEFFFEGNEKTGGINKKQFEQGIAKFEKVALLKYGNIKFGFKTLGRLNKEQLSIELQDLEPVDERIFSKRPKPLLSIDPIDPAETYYLGYLAAAEIAKGNDIKKKSRMDKIRRLGEENLKVYLCSDEMDVYVATSMRDIEDFYFVGTAAKKLFEKAELKKLKLRYFDPTQSYCEERIEKGLVEGLMLRRAKCTVYCAQTNETLGKASELAVTLAQGKPVVVYAPKIKNENEVQYKKLCRKVAKIYSELYGGGLDEYYRKKLIERHAKRLYEENQNLKNMKLKSLENMLVDYDDDLFEKNALILQEKHPLGIQVDLSTGVANGVLVVRTLTDCARVIKDIMTNRLTFDVRRELGMTMLVENRTNCTYRLMVNDAMLTNSFWNFYKPSFSKIV
jgi:hypothetical protein